MRPALHTTVVRLLFVLLVFGTYFITVASTTTKIQIIDGEQKFLDGLGHEMIQWGMNNLNGPDYETVSIIGAQSSGKSTFHNNIFYTDFEVMDPKTRTQTTEGIWLSRDKTHNIIVMDVEGSDGGSSADDQNFERKLALFALACSRLLVVNLWEHQVGLYHGANMGLLRIVFEEHLSMYGNLDRRVYPWPKIVFVIQGHSGATSLESLARTLLQDLNRVWESIKKPDGLVYQTLQEYFDFGFESLPNMLSAPDQYQSSVALLRKRFVERENSDYILGQTHPNSIPADGLELYMRMIWDKILLNENLNLPGQHELLARAMCDKISQSLIEKYRPEITSQLAILNEGKIIDGLGFIMQDWKSNILGRYDQEARRYDSSIYEEKRVTLIHSFHEEVSQLFGVQLKNLRLSLLAAFDKVLEESFWEKDAEFISISSNTKHAFEEDFIAAARNVALDGAKWNWEIEFEALRSGMVARTKACERKRDAVKPVQATKQQRVASGRWITTMVTLYRNGKLVVEVDTSSVSMFGELRGRVLVVVRDRDGNEIGVTNEMRCATRGGAIDLFTSSSGIDIFSLQFPGDVGRRAAALDIYHGHGFPGVSLDHFLKVVGIVVAAVA